MEGINAVRTGSDPTLYMRFNVGERGIVARQTCPVISIRADVGKKMRDVLGNSATLRSLYKREIATVMGWEDFSGHGYGETEYEAGLGWKYTRKPADAVFNAIKAAMKLPTSGVEDIFLLNHLIPLLPETFWGSSQHFVTPEYFGDPGVGYADSTSEVRRTKQNITVWLDAINPLDDINYFFNARRGNLSNIPSIIDNIRTLLASPKAE